MTDWYEKHNIAIYDQQGQLLSLWEVLSQVAEIWPDLTKNEQAYYLNTQAGANQSQNLAAILANFNTALEANEVALNSAGSAAQENERYMESLSAKLATLQSSFQNLSNSVLESDLVKFFLDLANAFLELLNDMPPLVTQFGLLSGVMTGVFGLAKFYVPVIKGIVGGFAQMTTGISGLTAAFSNFGVAGIAVAAGLTAIIALAPKISDWINEITGNYGYLKDKIDKANVSIDENRDKLIKLESIPPANRTEEIQAEIDKLKEENAILQENIANWESRIEESPEAVTAKSNLADKYLGRTVYRWAADQADYVASSMDEAAQMIADKYAELGQELDPEIIKHNLYEIETSFDDVTQAINADLLELSQSTNDYLNILRTNPETGLLDMTEEQKTAFGEFQAELYEVKADLEEYIEATGDLEGAQATQLNTVNQLIEQLEPYNKLLYDGEDILQTAIQAEYMNFAQKQALVALYPELIQYIDQEDEGWVLLTDSLYDAAIAGNKAAQDRIDAAWRAADQEIASIEATILAYQELIRTKQVAAGTDEYYQNIQDQLDLTESLWSLRLYRDELKSIRDQFPTDTVPDDDTGGGRRTTSAEDKTANALEKQKQLLQDQLALLDDRAYFAEKNGATEEEIVKIYQDAQEAIHQTAEYYREQGLDDESEYLRETGKLWIEYQEKIEGIYQDIEDAAKEAWENAIQAQIESLEEQQSVYEKFFSYMGDRIDEEISALQSQRDSVEQYWDDRIAKLQAENAEIERQIQLEQARMALAQAQSTQMLVYKDGEFQYVQDVQAISDAEAELEALEREEALRQEVANLETLKEQALASIDAQIANWEAYKEEWTSVVEHYQEEQDRLLIEQELGIELEGENWKLRLDNLESYVSQYEALMERLKAAQASANAGYSGGSSGGTGRPGTAKPDYSGVKRGGSGGVYWTEPDRNQTFSGGATYDQVRDSYLNPKYFGHASGTMSAPGGLSLVGEEGPELRVLNQGDGIIPSDITKNLWDIGKLSVDQILQGKGSSYVYNFDNLTLPNVTDAMSFIRELANFKRYAMQQ